MARRKERSPEEQARREKIRELLQLADVGSMDDIHELFKETIGSSWRTVWRRNWTRNSGTANIRTIAVINRDNDLITAGQYSP